MPLFEYKCESCKRVTEVLALTRDDDVPPAVCPHCAAERFSKQFSSFSAMTAGGGELPQMSCMREQGGCGSGNCCMSDD